MPPRVLVLDDDRDAVRLIGLMLRAMGCDVYTTTQPRVALEILAQRRPDVLLTDTMMPDMCGGEVITWMRAQPELRHIPAVLVIISDRQIGDSQPDAVLMKPFLHTQIAGVIAPLLNSDLAAQLYRIAAGERPSPQAIRRARELTLESDEV